MSEMPPTETTSPMPNPSSAAREARQAQIRAEAVTLLIAGALCLYFSFQWAPTPPHDASKSVQEMWMATDNAFFYSMRAIGVGFLLAAGVATSGHRMSLVIAMLAELALAALMLAMTIGWSWKFQAFNPMYILFLLFGLIAFINASRTWRLYRAIVTGTPDPTE